MALLGVVIISFGFRVYTQRDTMKRHAPEIFGATILSALFSLFSTAFAAKAIGLSSGGLGALGGGQVLWKEGVSAHQGGSGGCLPGGDVRPGLGPATVCSVTAMHTTWRSATGVLPCHLAAIPPTLLRRCVYLSQPELGAPLHISTLTT
jgi:hypothetical protein